MPAIEFRAGVDADFEFFFDLHKQTLGPYVDMVWGGQMPTSGTTCSARSTCRRRG